MTTGDVGPTAEFLPELDVVAPERQRRWTVLLRLLLLIPQFVVLYFLGIAAGVVLFLGWWGALFMGRLPYWAADFLTGFLGYTTRVNAYVYLLVDTYPPFRWQPEGYPVAIRVQPGRLNRWAVFFRFILVIPAAVVAAVVTAGWSALSFFIWLVVLILGRTPKPVLGATAAMARYEFRVQAYWSMLSPAYPKRLFGDAEPAEVESASITRPLALSSGGRVMLVIYLVLGVLGLLGGGTGGGVASNDNSSTTTAS